MTDNLFWYLYTALTIGGFYLGFVFPLRKKVSWEDYTIATLFSYSLAITIILARLLFVELMK